MRPDKTESIVSSTDQLIDSRRLFYFHTVARLGSFTAAEAALDIAQSALTRQILQLENDLQTKLFVRHGRGVKLTREGELLFSRSSEILRAMEDTIGEIRITKSKPGGRVAIAATPNFTARHMPSILDRIIERFPDAHVIAMEATSGGAHELLVSGRVDVAILIDSVNASKLWRTPLITEDLQFVCGAAHPAAGKDVIRPADWSKMQLLLPAAPNGTRDLVDRYFRQNGIDVIPAIEADSLSLSKSLLRSGNLCAMLARSTCQEEIDRGELVAIPLSPKLTRTLSVACLRDRKRTPLIEAMLEEVQDAVGRRPA